MSDSKVEQAIAIYGTMPKAGMVRFQRQDIFQKLGIINGRANIDRFHNRQTALNQSCGPPTLNSNNDTENSQRFTAIHTLLAEIGVKASIPFVMKWAGFDTNNIYKEGSGGNTKYYQWCYRYIKDKDSPSLTITVPSLSVTTYPETAISPLSSDSSSTSSE